MILSRCYYKSSSSTGKKERGLTTLLTLEPPNQDRPEVEVQHGRWINKLGPGEPRNKNRRGAPGVTYDQD